ncbi:hypothetical protein [Sphingobium sp.]|uniref:hypothetical protein n=1 Tax=Sphingobium sp. TaxID=1912891 RepID=UPI002C9C3FB4|nr:hypothetical protein [Sphingobium sp.]HUD94868.1 hypothetical protein [Sphingobium sp.]
MSMKVTHRGTAKMILQESLAAGLRLAGWLVVNLLVSLGVLTLAVVTLGGFSIEGTMHHLANLSARYIAAAGGRRHQFDMIVIWALAAAFCACGVFRRDALMHFLVGSPSDD